METMSVDTISGVLVVKRLQEGRFNSAAGSEPVMLKITDTYYPGGRKDVDIQLPAALKVGGRILKGV